MAIVPDFAGTMQHKHCISSDTNEAHAELSASRAASRTSNFLEAVAGRIAT
jgi:hypothetical protein